MSFIDVYPDPSKVDTSKFLEAQRKFHETGKYINALSGTIPYKEYWLEENRRCIEGFEIGISTEQARVKAYELAEKNNVPEDDMQSFIDSTIESLKSRHGTYLRITGIHYFYLNYCPIFAFDEKLQRKVNKLPEFIDMDYYYFLELEAAKNSGKGMIVAKARRKGFSYKNAAICVWAYNFLRESKTYVGAYLAEYAETTMGMSREMINFLDIHTAWARRKNPNTKTFLKAAHKETVDGVEVEMGFKSQMQTLTFKDNPSAGIGKSCEYFLFEEAGKWPNLIQSYQLTLPALKEGAKLIGTPIIFGTGGDMDGATNDFAEMFYDPSRYNLRSYVNEWDDGSPDKRCGFFISSTWYWVLDETFDEETGKVKNKDGLVDMPDGTRQLAYNKGISNHEVSLQYLKEEREQMRKTDSRQTWESYITQYPIQPREAFLKVKHNMFPTVELSNWLAQIRSSKELSTAGIAVKLYKDEYGKVLSKIDKNLFPIKRFPHKETENLEGAIIIYEEPYRDDVGFIPDHLYIAGTDPYDHDESTTSSLGSTIIYKQFNHFGTSYSRIVAEYTGRPESADEFYENTRLLLEYYNAITLYENQLKNMQTYFKNNGCLHLLEEQPDIIKSIVKNSKVKRGYGIQMSDPIKRQAELYLKQWLTEKRGVDENGNTIYNYHTILSPTILEELISYYPKGNFDRVIALFLVMLYMQNSHSTVERMTKPTQADPFFQRSLYQKTDKPTVTQHGVRPINDSNSGMFVNFPKSSPFYD